MTQDFLLLAQGLIHSAVFCTVASNVFLFIAQCFLQWHLMYPWPELPAENVAAHLKDFFSAVCISNINEILLASIKFRSLIQFL
jgi:hypothetical protein